jgi:hypothetical protein
MHLPRSFGGIISIETGSRSRVASSVAFKSCKASTGEFVGTRRDGRASDKVVSSVRFLEKYKPTRFNRPQVNAVYVAFRIV